MYNSFNRCADGYMGPRCEYKDLDGSYIRKYSQKTIYIKLWPVGQLSFYNLIYTFIKVVQCAWDIECI